MKKKLRLIIVSLIGVVIIAGIGTYLYFTFGATSVNGLEEFDNLDPNDNRPVNLNLSEEEIDNMTKEEREKFGIPDNWKEEVGN